MSEYKDYNYQNDEITHNFKYMLQPLLKMLDKNKNQCILDLDCGNGYLVNHLISLGYNAYGTNASEKGIAIASEINPGRFFVQDLSTDQLPAEIQGLYFDTVIPTKVIEHLYGPESFIGFCKQALAAGGEIIISTPYHGYLKNILISLSNKWDQHLNPVWLGGHIKMWSAKTLGSLLTGKDFTVTNLKDAAAYLTFGNR
jgi:2-polyprenyl-3-methyl-5-hydroxy-6-metoxy-1,4-benzoquinol methylase